MEVKEEKTREECSEQLKQQQKGEERVEKGESSGDEETRTHHLTKVMKGNEIGGK